MKSIELSKIWGIALVVTFLSFTMSAQAATYSVVRNFNQTAGGEIPYGQLLMDPQGNLYGAASAGGPGNSGTIFQLSPNGSGGWNYTTLYQCGTTNECTVPMGSLVMDQSGDLYGVTYFGNVFELSPNGSGMWTATLVHAFNGGVDGNAPSPLTLDAAGNLYGANATGGTNNLGYIFELSPTIGGWSLIHLHDFSGSDGAESINTAGQQIAALIQDADGNLYGTTAAGGSGTTCQGGCGVVFKLQNQSGTWNETVLHSFTGNDGAAPDAALLLDATGMLYGTTTSGGSNGKGVLFRMQQSSASWRMQILHNFTGIHLDGAYPNAALTMDDAGNLFGATLAGGANLQGCQVMSDTGCGTVFELSPNSTGGWKMTILHAFSGRKDGGFPEGIVRDRNGNLFGGAEAGGAGFEGLVFKISQ